MLFTLYTPTDFFVQFSIEAVADESSLVRIIDLPAEEKSSIQKLQFSADNLHIYMNTEHKV